MVILIISLLSLLFLLITFHGRSQTRTPSPQSYPIIGNLIGVLRNYHRFYDWAIDLSVEANSLTFTVTPFLGLPRILFTVDPANLHHLLKSNFHNYIKGSRFNDVLHDLLGRGIFNADSHLWSVQRKIASHEFNTRSLKSFISLTVRREISARLLPLLSRASDADCSLDLQSVFQQFAFNNICNLAFDFDPDCLVSAEDFARSFDAATDICFARLLTPIPAIWKIKRLLNVGSERRMKEAIATIDRFAFEIIRSKEEKLEEEKLDLLSRFMRSKVDSELEFNTPDERRRFFRDIIVSFILAGKDSTSSALTWFFWLIAGHPRCEKRIMEEIEMNGDVENYDDLKRFNYLQAAITESMRLFPPVPGNSRLTVSDDVLPDGSVVKRGWAADFGAYAMGRMERVWGPDCAEFRPERWLDGEGGFQACDPYKYPVFHAGPRMCLGKEMAYVQMKAVVVAVLSRFEVVVVDGGATAERMRNPPYQLGLTLKMKDGLVVKLRRRK